MTEDRIVTDRIASSIGGRRVLALALSFLVLLVGCYPKYDWRDYRPDCERVGWCAFSATFPGKVASATRDVPVGATKLPLTLHVASIGDTTFAVGAFEIKDGADATEARRVLEAKLVDDSGATSPARSVVALRASDRSGIPGEAFEAEGLRAGTRIRAAARFAVRGRYLVELVVIGPADTLGSRSGQQAIETFFTSIRLD